MPSWLTQPISQITCNILVTYFLYKLLSFVPQYAGTYCIKYVKTNIDQSVQIPRLVWALWGRSPTICTLCWLHPQPSPCASYVSHYGWQQHRDWKTVSSYSKEKAKLAEHIQGSWFNLQCWGEGGMSWGSMVEGLPICRKSWAQSLAPNESEGWGGVQWDGVG